MSTLSHVRGALEPPLLEMTIGAALARARAQWPDAEALVSVHQNVRWSWAEFGRRSEQLAAGLLAIGLRPGDRVGVWAPNCAEWTLAQFATARAGMIQVNINPAYRLAELEYTLNKVEVKALIAAEAFKSSDYVAMVETLAPEFAAATPGALDAARLPHLRAAIKLGAARPGWLRFEDVAQAAAAPDQAELALIEASLDRNEPINIQFTSGTTGLPKGATLSHRNILNNAYFVGLAMGLTAGDRLCIPVPLYHCLGMVMRN